LSNDVTFRSGGNKLILLDPDVVPPLDSASPLIGPRTILAADADVQALEFDAASIGDVFDNASIDFDLDPISVASSSSENVDNWGVGPAGLDVSRLWQSGIQGHGVRLGIADSGMDSTHPAFTDLVAEHRLAGFAHFDGQGQKQLQRRPDGTAVPDDEAVPTFSHGHGTHCAGVLVGQAMDGKMRGVAPQAELVVARVLDTLSSGTVAGIASGLWWLTDQRCDVVSMSLGWPGLHEEWAEPVSALLAAGVVVVAAVGNEGTVPGTPKSRSPANYLTSLDAPTKGVLIPVGAHDQSGSIWPDSDGETVDWSHMTVRRTDGSSRPSIFATAPPRIVPTLVAPGVDVVSSFPGNLYMSSSGTSQATPHVAGLIALVLSALRRADPSSTPRAAADLVLGRLRDLPPTGMDVRSGDGRVDNDLLVSTLMSVLA
jgi:subtilisin family serine protease